MPHTLHRLDFEKGVHKTAQYLERNPQGRVTTLVLDGQVLTESVAIAMQLADLHPQACLAPALGSQARDAYYRWMLLCAYTLMPAHRGWFYAGEPAGSANMLSG